MQTTIIKIGNSKGIRIPKPLLEQCGIEKEVELKVKKNEIIIKPVKAPRKGWEDAFKKMIKNNDDKLLIDFPQNEWDEKEWEWK